MLRSDRSTNQRGRLLGILAAELRLPPAQIVQTAAWQRHSEASDSLDLVELVMEVHEELEREPLDD